MKGSYSSGRGSRGKMYSGSRGKMSGYGGYVGAGTNACARHPRAARAKAVRGRTTKGAVSSRPMEFTYREVPFGTPRANIKGL